MSRYEPVQQEINDYPYFEGKAFNKGLRVGLLVGFVGTVLVSLVVEVIILMFI